MLKNLGIDSHGIQADNDIRKSREIKRTNKLSREVPSHLINNSMTDRSSDPRSNSLKVMNSHEPSMKRRTPGGLHVIKEHDEDEDAITETTHNRESYPGAYSSIAGLNVNKS